MELISRAQAKEQGVTKYFTGKPCPREHVCERKVASGACVQCVRDKQHAKDAADPARKTRRLAAQYARKKAAGTLWNQRNPERTKEMLTRARLRRNFGITLEQYNTLLEQQKGKCAICGKMEWRALAVDHNHDDGRVRGLLCSVCNKNLGVYEKNKELFADYLQLTAKVDYRILIVGLMKGTK